MAIPIESQVKTFLRDHRHWDVAQWAVNLNVRNQVVFYAERHNDIDDSKQRFFTELINASAAGKGRRRPCFHATERWDSRRPIQHEPLTGQLQRLCARAGFAFVGVDDRGAQEGLADAQKTTSVPSQAHETRPFSSG